MKSRDLTGPALAYACAVAEGLGPTIEHPAVRVAIGGELRAYAPHSDWRDTGRLVTWETLAMARNMPAANVQEAICRAFVVRYFGEEIELPGELSEWAL